MHIKVENNPRPKSKKLAKAAGVVRDVVLFLSTSRLVLEAQDTIILILDHSFVRGAPEENRLKDTTKIRQYDISRQFSIEDISSRLLVRETRSG